MRTVQKQLEALQTQHNSTSQSVRKEKQPQTFDYDTAFARNRGLISAEEQNKLKQSRVAIAGMGGVGGVHLMTLARLGVGQFRIADPDHFELANFNRQYGARVETIGHSKVRAMTDEALAVNDKLDIDAWEYGVMAENVDEFLQDIDIFIDGIDFFSFQTRRLVFNECRRRNIWAVTAGPIGFSTAWVTFDPQGMSFDEYFDIRDKMDNLDMFAAFTMGLTPKGTHWKYLDLSQVDSNEARGPSVGLACNLASGVACTEACKILLGRSPVRAAPYFSQFDAYRGVLRQGKLRWGNRGPMQRLKRRILRKRIEQFLK